MKRLTSLAIVLFLAGASQLRADQPAATDSIRIEKDISYLPSSVQRDAYADSQCRLDLYLPAKTPDGGFPIVVWFHGGGLTGGSKGNGKSALAKRFVEQGIAVADVGYRLSPKVKYPAYLEDSAKAVAWVVAEGRKRGVNPGAIFVSGHSAGGYISAMLAMDQHLLTGAGVASGAVAGFIPVSGQWVTHFTVREERGIPKERIVSDAAAPIYHARKDAPPILVLVGDHDMAGRLEEAKLFDVVMKDVAGNKTTTVVVVADRTHGSINDKLLTPGDTGGETFLAFVKEHARPPKDAAK
jgi:acetyl esterase/lipase